jgi:hypothetical protein
MYVHIRTHCIQGLAVGLVGMFVRMHKCVRAVDTQ